MKHSLVVAASENNVIGKDNKLLWHLPNDLKFFKNVTWGLPVIMGRKTFESMGKPLKGRTNIVITGREGWSSEGVLVARNFEEALMLAEETDAKEVHIIGGGEVYRQAIHKADLIHFTRVHTTIEGDTYFPDIDFAQWEQVSNLDFKADDKHAYDYSLQVWKRRSHN